MPLFHTQCLFQQDVQYIFYGLFLLEAVLKFIGLGVKGYFNDNWNRFDFLILLVSSTLFIVEEAEGSPGVGLFATVVRGLRLLRLLKLHSTFKQVCIAAPHRTPPDVAVSTQPVMPGRVACLCCSWPAYGLATSPRSRRVAGLTPWPLGV